ncbi:sensor histidine kinase [Gracilimonas mengyeensis]|uniref:histidine kinase n=1 Tax=Gracilimonas mengyeensis TaxID=1302730 RepID=A0A521BZF5_9BACT|nr:histidine kinase dimerization/phosphoacceptor domain -containing protein [Gracilimonas mengyeensis]SMO52557.1 PAS domain S-box-containing protein [Gracilimonas mengyeensis]
MGFSSFFRSSGNSIDNSFLFDKLLDTTSDLIYFKDTDSRFIKASMQLAKRLGASRMEELIGKTDFDFFSEEHARQAYEDEQQIMETRVPKIGIIEKETFTDGRVLWSSTSKFPLVDESEKVIGTFGISRDITARKQAEDKLKKSKKQLQNSLKEKEVLLAEVHHRVKNNLAVISGMLELQRDHANNTDTGLEMISTMQSRILSIANVHELLYKTENFAEINIRDLVVQLCEDICHSYQSDVKTVSFEIDVDRIILTPNRAVPFSLLMNELIQNSYNHAFTGKKEGEISIVVKRTNGEVEVVYSDNGKGMSESFEEVIEKSNSLGLTLIKTLSKQIEAYAIHSSNSHGFSYRFRFRNPSH